MHKGLCDFSSAARAQFVVESRPSRLHIIIIILRYYYYNIRTTGHREPVHLFRYKNVLLRSVLCTPLRYTHIRILCMYMYNVYVYIYIYIYAHTYDTHTVYIHTVVCMRLSIHIILYSYILISHCALFVESTSTSMWCVCVCVCTYACDRQCGSCSTVADNVRFDSAVLFFLSYIVSADSLASSHPPQ
jgi:hypothetical protein